MSNNEWTVDMNDMEDMTFMPDKKEIEEVPNPFMLQSEYNCFVEPNEVYDEEKAMKAAAKRAVKSSTGVVYIYKLIGKVEQTNYEALVTAETYSIPSNNLLEDKGDEAAK